MAFPDDLPPEGLDETLKLLIYLGLGYILLTAFTSYLITRGRARPKHYDDEYYEDDYDESILARPIGNLLSFEDSVDILASLKIEAAGSAAAMNELRTIKSGGEISEDAYDDLVAHYNAQINQIQAKINDMMKTSVISKKTGMVEQGISDDEMAEIEEDLQSQLQDMDADDDFLKPKTRKTPVSDIMETQIEKPEAPPAKAPTPMQEVLEAAAPAAAPTKANIAPPPPQSGSKQPTPMPPPPPGGGEAKSGVIPTPTKTETSEAPASAIPRAEPPASMAAQPKQVQSDQNEQIFAKSTSIAALRMDMLRELARLKKLINEDE